jgi:hypothetical protein
MMTFYLYDPTLTMGDAGGVALVQLDPTLFTLDHSTNPPTLRVADEVKEVFKEGVPLAPLKWLPVANSEQVFYEGALLTPDLDYTLMGQTLTILHLPVLEAVIQVVYRPATL